MSRNALFALLAVIVFLLPSRSEARRAGPEFTPGNPIVLPQAKANETYNLDLTTMLANQGAGELLFYLDEAPAWLSLVPANSKNLIGHPTTANIGNISFKLSVKEAGGELGDFNRPTRLTVMELPQFSSNPLILGTQREEAAWTVNLSTFITNPQAGPFTFSATGLPTWMSLSGQALSGTPPWTQNHQHAGNYSGIRITATGPGGLSQASAQGAVEKTYRPPQWTAGTNTLVNALEGSLYNQSITGYVRTFELGPVTFAKVSGPAWTSVDRKRAGTISGTPSRPDVGPTTVSVSLSQVVDGSPLSGGSSNFTFQVIEVLHPPVWKFDPLELGLTREDQPFRFDLAPHVTDPENSTLTFSASGLPSWMSLNSGVLSGTPPWSSHHVFVGSYSGIRLTVTATGGSAHTTARGEVGKTIKGPRWVGNPISIVDADEDAPYLVDIVDRVQNFEEKPLTFTLISGPAWLRLTQSGTFAGTPGKNDLGSTVATAKVTSIIDGQLYNGGTTTFTFNVNHVNHAPVWLADPLELEPAYTKKPYTQNLARSATDPDGDIPLTFAKIDGPAWVSFSATGEISGTPTNADVGLTSVVVSVKDPGGLEDRAVVKILVKKTPEPPTWKNPVVLVPAAEDVPYVDDLAKYVSNPDELPLTFTLLSNNGFDWVRVNSGGSVTGTPSAHHVGLNKFSVRVSSGQMSDTADALVEVVHSNHAPYWVMDPIRIPATEDQPLTKDISVYAADKDKALFNDTLIFGLVTFPAGSTWLAVSDKGVITGTPGASAVGAKEYQILVSDNHGSSARVTVIVDTKHINHAPKWTEDPITLADGKEGTPYTATLASFIIDPDIGDTHRFQKVSGTGAEWLTVSAGGLVSGTPARKDIGPNQFKVRVFDSGNLFADVTVKLNVQKVKHPAYWTQNPILLGTALEDTPFTFDLTPYAKGDGEEDVLIFEKVQGPDWVIVSSAGLISGIPQHADIGKFSVTFKVANDVGGGNTVGTGEVLPRNHAPVINQAALDFKVKEREQITVDLSNPLYIVDKDGDKLRCNPMSSLPFATLGNDCTLSLKPKHEHVRPEPYSLNFSVADQEFSVKGTILVTVLRDPQKPECDTNILYVAKTNESFSESLKTRCRDLDGVPLTFERAGTWPTWLGMDAAGTLSGMPKNPDVSESIVLFSAKNDVLSTGAQFTMRVIPGTQEDKFQIDTPVVGATTENLWIVDNSYWCSPLMADLKKYIGVYYGALNKAGVALHHSGIMLSSDVDKFKALPIRDPNLTSDPSLFTWMTPNIFQDFGRRLGLAYFNGFCSNCNSSPIWALYRFQEQAPTLSIYHNGYFTERTPMDVLMVTRQRDHYKTYTSKLPSMKQYTPGDFADDFIQFSKSEKQSLRISAIAPECAGGDREIGSGLIETTGDPSFVAPANAYKIVVDATRGLYYPTGCAFKMQTALEDYAKWVIFRAFVHGNRVFTLTKQPTEIHTIRVSLKGVALVGNTGNATDKWRYHAASNSIEIYWENIDLGTLVPGDRISILYRVS